MGQLGPLKENRFSSTHFRSSYFSWGRNMRRHVMFIYCEIKHHQLFEDMLYWIYMITSQSHHRGFNLILTTHMLTAVIALYQLSTQHHHVPLLFHRARQYLLQLLTPLGLRVQHHLTLPPTAPLHFPPSLFPLCCSCGPSGHGRCDPV